MVINKKAIQYLEIKKAIIKLKTFLKRVKMKNKLKMD